MRPGRAVTHGQALPLGVDDPVIAARAVRRALADAGRRAMDVVALAVASPAPIDADSLARFARRALGPHGADVRLSALEVPDTDAEALADQAARAVEAAGPISRDVAIAVGLGVDGTTVALCLEPLRGLHDPGFEPSRGEEQIEDDAGQP